MRLMPRASRSLYRSSRSPAHPKSPILLNFTETSPGLALAGQGGKRVVECRGLPRKPERAVGSPRATRTSPIFAQSPNVAPDFGGLPVRRQVRRMPRPRENLSAPSEIAARHQLAILLKLPNVAPGWRWPGQGRQACCECRASRSLSAPSRSPRATQLAFVFRPRTSRRVGRWPCQGRQACGLCRVLLVSLARAVKMRATRIAILFNSPKRRAGLGRCPVKGGKLRDAGPSSKPERAAVEIAALTRHRRFCQTHETSRRAWAGPVTGGTRCLCRGLPRSLSAPWLAALHPNNADGTKATLAGRRSSAFGARTGGLLPGFGIPARMRRAMKIQVKLARQSRQPVHKR